MQIVGDGFVTDDDEYIYQVFFCPPRLKVRKERKTAQSAISKLVANLEAQLGVKLLNRTTRSLSMTNSGAAYFEAARRLVAEVAEAETHLQRGEHQLQGWLRVAASVGFGRLKLLPVIQQFLTIHPNVKIDLIMNDGFVDLVERDIDVSVRIGNLADSSMIARKVGESVRALIASPSYFERLSKPLQTLKHPSDLAHHNCIVYTEYAMGNAWEFPSKERIMGKDSKADDIVVNIAGNFQTNSSEIIRASVLGGMGIGYSPTWLFEDALNSAAVHIVLPQWPRRISPIHLISPAQRRNSAKVKAFGEFVVAAFKSDSKN